MSNPLRRNLIKLKKNYPKIFNAAITGIAIASIVPLAIGTTVVYLKTWYATNNK